MLVALYSSAMRDRLEDAALVVMITAIVSLGFLPGALFLVFFYTTVGGR